MTSRLWIVRHGNTFDKGDTVTRVGGRTDLPLSESGKAQAETLEKFFLKQVVNIETAITSPLLRTRETAEAILAGRAGPLLETAEFLREIDYGPDENQPEAAVIARIGQAALDAWEAEAVPPPGWIVDPPALQEGWRGHFDRLRAIPGDHLAVTSNGIARFALLALGQGGDHTLKLPTGGYGLINVEPTGATAGVWGKRP